ncbi:MAG TPA: OmpH family outer membrane protein [Opitutaceae bacterium]|nr:OmpH family outer membrane protein [Opitutaceae bacterium]
MKNTIRSLVALATLSVFALAARAEPAVKILVVDMAKLYDNHYKTLEQNAKLQADQEKAKQEVDQMNKEGNALVEEYKNLQEQSTNAALTAEAKSKAQNDAQKKLEEIQAKQNEIRTFIQNSGQTLNQRLQTFRSLMLEEIGKVATEVAKRHGATILLDKSGPSLIGISNLIYSDPAYDITDEVMTEINKTRPAGAPTAPVPAPSTSGTATAPAASTSTSSGPMINVPIGK